jgi:protein SCO1/2
VRLRAAVLSVLAASALAAGCSASGGGGGKPQPSELIDNAGGSGPYQGFGLVPPRPRPAFTLTDTAGHPYSFSARTHGRTTMLYFGYTNCPDICPATMADISNALRTLPAAEQRKVTVVFISTDVKHDTGPVIAAWLKNFDLGAKASFVGLHGTKGQIDAAQAAAHITIAEDGGQTHSTQVLLYGPDDYARDSFIYNNSQERGQMAHDLKLVVKGQT